jgi:hypothetical protein
MTSETDISTGSRLRQGIGFGVFAGVGYSIAVFGLDALKLAGASADHYWWKLAIALLLFVLIGGIAGGLTSASDSSLVGFISWLVAGVVMGWLTGHIPFEGFTRLAGLLYPDFRGLDLYPISQAAQLRTGLIIATMAIAGGLVGALQLTFQDVAQGASTMTGRVLAMLIWTMFLIVPGLGIDIEANEPGRSPFIATSRLIQFARQNQVTPVDPQEALDRHLGAIRGVDDLIGMPYRLVLGGYDAFAMSSVNVDIDFSGSWVRCTVVSGQPLYCARTADFFEKAFACLMQSANSGDEACDIEPSEAARRWLAERQEAIGPTPAVEISGIRGAATRVNLVDKDGNQYPCRLIGHQPIVLLGCE